MPSQIIGRTKCPECGFENAHVKKSDKGTLYRYCPNKGEQYFAKTEAQQEDLLAKTRLTPTATGSQAIAEPPAPATKPAEAPAPTGSEASASAKAPAPVPVAAPVAPKRNSLFNF